MSCSPTRRGLLRSSVHSDQSIVSACYDELIISDRSGVRTSCQIIRRSSNGRDRSRDMRPGRCWTDQCRSEGAIEDVSAGEGIATEITRKEILAREIYVKTCGSHSRH